MTSHFKILVLGAGSGGCSLVARISRLIPKYEIGIIEPSEVHFYQPLWTLVGAGLVKKDSTGRPMREVIPQGIKWIRDSVDFISPKENSIVLRSGKTITYEFLIVATGLQLDWTKLKGVEGNLGKNGLCSIYQYRDAEITAQMLKSFKGGTALFTMPPVPIKCAGAPQKIMYLADEIFRKNGVREKSKIVFAVAGGVIFGVPLFANALLKVVARKSIDVRYLMKLVEVRADEKVAVFERTIKRSNEDGEIASKELEEIKYDLMHVVPPMSAHAYVRKSHLAFESGPQEGWLEVDQATLQHKRFKNIFGIGDVTGIPNSKTGAAIRKQAPVVCKNLLDVMNGRPLSATYDGYSSCPLITGFGKVILAEFGYDGKLMPSFPMDMSKERRSMWILKKSLLPVMYWKGMMKGIF